MAVVIAFGLATASGSAVVAHDEEDGDAAVGVQVRGEMESGIADALAALRDDERSPAERAQAFRDVLAERIDFDIVSRLAIGRAWRELSAEQREEFTEQFTKHLLGIGAEAARQYRGEDVIITGDRRASSTDWIVETQIVRPRGRARDDGSDAAQPLVDVDFRLRARENQWRIIDVRIAGISMAAGFRSQFESVMRRGGIERVIEILRERNEAREAANHDEASQ